MDADACERGDPPSYDSKEEEEGVGEVHEGQGAVGERRRGKREHTHTHTHTHSTESSVSRCSRCEY